MRGTTLKQLSNKQALNIFRDMIVGELQTHYPEMVAQINLLNTPIFFQQLFDTQIKPMLSERTASKITMVSGSASDLWDADSCPKLYGGQS